MSSSCGLLFFTFATLVAVQSEILTEYGPIEGITITLFNKKKVDAFLGAPYAAPPIGLNRFAPPRPPQPWNTTLETKTLSNACLQIIKKELKPILWFAAQEPGSEDCLYLNIWRPKSSKGNKTDSLAVMVWFHSGGFFSGSASMPLYDGSILATENDVIVVSMNYRLDLFGFLYLNSSQVAENVGLQDQILAIKWVKENIRNFGGDPLRITLFGESAGAVSVGFHLVNTLLQDLFQNAIMESDSPGMEIASLTPDQAYNRTMILAGKVGCSNDDPKEVMKCLRNRSAEDLRKDADGMSGFGISNFRPVRNGVQVPLDIHTAAGNVPPNKRKNTINGNLPREIAYVITIDFPQKNYSENFKVTREDFSSLLDRAFKLTDGRLQSLVLHEYRNINETCYPEMLRDETVDILSDFGFVCPGIGFAKSYSGGSNQVFYYYFTHKPSKGIRLPIPEWMGVTYGDEIPFVFGVPLNPDNGYTAEEVILSKEIMTFWTNFAKYGATLKNRSCEAGPGSPPPPPHSRGISSQNVIRQDTKQLYFQIDH